MELRLQVESAVVVLVGLDLAQEQTASTVPLLILSVQAALSTVMEFLCVQHVHLTILCQKLMDQCAILRWLDARQNSLTSLSKLRILHIGLKLTQMDGMSAIFAEKDSSGKTQLLKLLETVYFVKRQFQTVTYAQQEVHVENA